MTVFGRYENYGGNAAQEHTVWCEGWHPEELPVEPVAERDETVLAIIKARRLLEVESLRDYAAWAEREEELVSLGPQQAREYADLLEKSL